MSAAAQDRQARWLAAYIDLQSVELTLEQFPNPDEDLLELRDEFARVLASFGVPLHERLPTELLVELFILCARDDPDTDTQPTRTVLPPRWNSPWWPLLHTCSVWRSTILRSIPELWANVSLTFSSMSELRTACEVYSAWLQNSANGTTALSIQVACTRAFAEYLHNSEESSQLGVFADTIVVPNASRIKQLDLTLPREMLCSLYALPETTFPLLEALSLKTHVFFSDFENDMQLPEAPTITPAWQWPASTPAFSSAPNLRSIEYNTDVPTIADVIDMLGTDTVQGSLDEMTSIGGTGTYATVRIPSARIVLPWRELRVVKFLETPQSVGTWHDALAQCARLEHLTALVCRGDNPEHPFPVVELSSLAELNLSAVEDAGDLTLAFLRTPVLSSAVLRGAYTVPSILALHTRSDNPALRNLFTTFHIPTPDAYALCAALSPSLEIFGSFLASTEHLPDAFWAALFSGELLPKLKGVVLSPRRTQVPVLIKEIARNWDGENEMSRLEPLGVVFNAVMPEEREGIEQDLEPLERFRAVGRVISWV